MKPVRVQRKRTKGWVMPENTGTSARNAANQSVTVPHRLKMPH